MVNGHPDPVIDPSDPDVADIGYRDPAPLPQRDGESAAGDETLRESTGRAPVPFWWPSIDVPAIGGRRPSVPHAAFAAAATKPPAEGSSANPKQFDTYVHWLYAQNLGYQGFSLPLKFPDMPKPKRATSKKEEALFAAEYKLLMTLVVTTPVPTKDHLAAAMVVIGVKKVEQATIFADFVEWLASFEEVHDVQFQADEQEGVLEEEPKKGPKKSRYPSTRRAKPGKVTWKPGEPEPPPVDGGHGESSMILLGDLYEDGQLTEKQYVQAIKAVKKTVRDARRASAGGAEPEPEPEEEPEPERARTPEQLEEVQAETDVAEEVMMVEPEPEVEPIDPPELTLGEVIKCGPSLDLLPHECEFEDAAEFSFDIDGMVQKYEGDALFCVLRRDNAESDWAPLDSTERIYLSDTGLAAVELHSFCEVQVVWMKSLHPWHTQALVELLAKGLLASLKSRGIPVDAAFRSTFRLECLSAVQIGTNASGFRWISQLTDLNESLESKVSTAVFAEGVRREAEAAAAAEAQRLLDEAAAAVEARIAGLPLMLHAACKKGNKGWMDDKDANPEGISIEGIMAEGTDLHLWTDGTGYTALYLSVMYEQQTLVDMLIAAGSDVPPAEYVDLENNNGVTALMAAARDGFTSIVLKLLAAGADYAQVDEFGRTADSVVRTRRNPLQNSICRDVSERLLAVAGGREGLPGDMCCSEGVGGGTPEVMTRALYCSFQS